MTNDGHDEPVTGPTGAEGAHFSDLFARFWDSTVADGETERQVAVIERGLQLQPRARIAVAPSRCGRLALALAGRGYKVVGVDRSADAISRSRLLADRACLDAEFRCSEDLSLAGVEEFDGAVYLGHGLDPDAIARNLAVALRAGACVIVDDSAGGGRQSHELAAAGFMLVDHHLDLRESSPRVPVQSLLIYRRI